MLYQRTFKIINTHTQTYDRRWEKTFIRLFTSRENITDEENPKIIDYHWLE